MEIQFEHRTFGPKDRFDMLAIAGRHTFNVVSAIVKHVNQIKAGGHDDWVIGPLSVVRAVSGMVDEDVCVWSSSPCNGNSNNAWVVSFYTGYVDYDSRYSNYAVRLVRASQCMSICDAGARQELADAGIEV